MWSHAILASIYPHNSGYEFPLTTNNHKQTKGLEILLKSGQQDGTIICFHNFIYPFLTAQQPSLLSNTNPSHWDSMYECLLAITSLQEDGNFKSPSQVPQIFAHAEYCMRGTILFEGYQNKAQFGNNVYKSVINCQY